MDLAVRGLLTITEIPAQGFFHGRDWRLTWTGSGTEGLRDYEVTVLEGIFQGRSEVLVSDLQGQLSSTMSTARQQLYRDATARAWFSADPQQVRLLWALAGGGLMLAGAGLAALLGFLWSGGVVGVAVGLVGVVLLVAANWMPRRTAAGRELLRQARGFRLYMETAERYRQQFAEREGLFTRLLPYAIVFGCVGAWVSAFSGLDTAAAVAAWYVGSTPFDTDAFSDSMSNLTSAIGTSGGAGGSGFDGGPGAAAEAAGEAAGEPRSGQSRCRGPPSPGAFPTSPSGARHPEGGPWGRPASPTTQEPYSHTKWQ